MTEAEAAVNELLRQRHSIGPGEEDDFTVRNLSEITSARAESQRILTLLLAAVASIALLVGGIGIMNIMLVSVTERTREIGLRMAVGARRRDILVQFLVEAVTLCLIGGLVGVIAGLGGAALVANLAGWPVLIEPLALVIAVAFSGAVGVFFGYYPAISAIVEDECTKRGIPYAKYQTLPSIGIHRIIRIGYVIGLHDDALKACRVGWGALCLDAES